MSIILASSQPERASIQAFFEVTFPDIEPDGVPAVRHDEIYTPLIPYLQDDDGQVIAAAMSCRSQLGAMAATAARAGRQDLFQLGALNDKHSELDLLAVQEDHQGLGLGSSLIRFLEAELVARGVRAWFGNVTVNLDGDRLRRFYTAHGFTVLPDSQPLPPLLGQDWVTHTEKPQFYFYKRPRPVMVSR